MEQQNIAASAPANVEAPTFASIREELDEIRVGMTINRLTGRPAKRPAHEVNRDLYTNALRFLKARGEFFVAGPNPYYLDRADNRLILMSADDPEFARLLRNFGLLANEPHTRIISRTLIEYAYTTERKKVSPFSHMALDSTVYLRTAATRMLKITPTDIVEVPIGTDGVVMTSEDLGEWPVLEEFQSDLDALRDVIGNATTSPIADSPLSKLTTRWESNGLLTQDQQQELFLTRLMFLVAADRYSLWPLLLHTGGENAGKSTPFELALALFRGEKTHVGNFPDRQQDFVATITNTTLIVFDNIDGAGLHLPAKSSYSDLICQVSTGAQITMRRLYANNKLDKHNLQAHLFVTARVVPFDRSDVMRRAIHLELAPPSETETVVKDQLRNRVLEDRLPMLAEFILRTQNIVRAHAALVNAEYKYQTQMREYEQFTLVCADYEGRLRKAQAVWTAYMKKHATAITQDNPLVSIIRLWLGKAGNEGRQVSSTTLHAELKALTGELHVSLPYKSATALGTIMGRHQQPLRAIGWTRPRTQGGHDNLFSPSYEELQIARKHYSDARAAADKYPTSTFGTRGTPQYESQCTMTTDDINDDLDN